MRSEAFYKLPRGYTRTPLYRAYHDMKDRCYKPQKSNFKYYGGKGIKVCQEWLESYYTFYEWAMSNGYRQGLQIDRIDNSKDYCPENCRWSTKIEQENNKTTNVRIEFRGESHTISEWARIKGLTKGCLRTRLVKGWSTEKALTTKAKPRKRKVENEKV